MNTNIEIMLATDIVATQEDIQNKKDFKQRQLDESFLSDLRINSSFIRLIENNLLWIKHFAIPLAIQKNELQIKMPIDVGSYLSSWINADARVKELAQNLVLQELQSILSSKGFIVERTPATTNYIISWK